MPLNIGTPARLRNAFSLRGTFWRRQHITRTGEVSARPPQRPLPDRNTWQDAERALQMSPEQEQPLLDEGIPPDGSPIYRGGKRPADTPQEAARKFVIWARAVGVTGSHSTRRISALYWECAEADHRRAVPEHRFLNALQTMDGIRVGPSTADTTSRVWTIEPAQSQLSLPLSGTEPLQAGEPAKRNRIPVSRFVPEREFESQQLLQANAHYARRMGSKARKQRGSRDARWAAA
jgi:hypothetical protein